MTLGALTAGGGAAAQVETEVDVEPDWRRKPSSEDLLAVWPREALRQGRGGKAVVACKVTVQGRLYECRALSEKPEGSGFGMAAVALTAQFVMTPAIKAGKPVAYDSVKIPINFTWPGGPGGGGGPSRKVVSNVAWSEAPTYSQVADAFPAKSREKRVGGSATVSCTFKSDGRLKGCDTLGETPWNGGFGSAAKGLMPLFLGPTKFSDGAPITNASTQIVVTFPVEMIDNPKPIIGKPQWAQLPSAQRLQSVVPPEAIKTGVTTARVVLACTVATGGSLDNCKVDREEPLGQGLGAATLELSKDFRLTIWTAEGLPTVGGTVRVPLRFEAPEAPAKP